MPHVLEVQRWCPKCQKVLTATRYFEREGGGGETSSETLCPECGTPGELLLQR
jgi:endogenous inhibitor of DNA gyrase (YacG/DUF329 family)